MATPWTAARQASLSITKSQSLLKFMSIESVMPSNHLIFCLPLLPSVFPSIRVFSSKSALHIRWPKDWSFSFNMEKGMATHFSILAWRIPWTEEPGGLQSVGCKESNTTERQTLSFLLFYEKETERLKEKPTRDNTLESRKI